MPSRRTRTGGSAAQGFTDAEQVARVEASCAASAPVGNSAPLVVLVGHGSNSVNNLHRAAYDCGACSASWRPECGVFAAMANRPVIRAALAGHGIAIPTTPGSLAPNTTPATNR